MTTAERKKLEEEARQRQKSLPLSSSYRKRMEEEARKKQRELSGQKRGIDLPATLADERAERPASLLEQLDADIAERRRKEEERQAKLRLEREEQSKAVAEAKTPKLSDINRAAANVDYSPEIAAGRLKYEQENPTQVMSALEKLEYNARKYNPLALADMAINAAGAGVAQFGAQVGDIVTAPFKSQPRYPNLDAWKGKPGPEPEQKNALEKYIDSAKNTLHSMQESRRRYYTYGGTLQNKAEEYTAKLGERYADLNDNAVTKALSDLSSATGYMVPTIISNAIIPNSGTALLFSAGFASGERQALQEGASAEDARNYGLLNGLNQSLGELLVGGIMGIGAGAIKSLALRAGIDLTKNIIHPGIRALANGILSGLGEGAEEIAQSGIDTLAKRATYDPNAKFDLGEAAYEGLIAGFMGTGGNAVESVLNARNASIIEPLQSPADTKNAVQREKTGAQTSPAQDYYNRRVKEMRAKEADLFGRLRTVEEDEIFNRLTAAKNNTEKSGILAGASDEVIAKASKVAEAGGVDILFERIERTAAGNIVDGYEYGGKLYINPESQRSVEFIQGHELTHSIEKAKSYDKLSRYVLNRMGAEAVEAERQRIGNIRTAEGQALTAEQIDREIVADWAGRNLLKNEADIVDIVRTDRTLAERIKDWLTGMVKRFTGTTEEKFYSHARSLYIKALNEARKAEAVDAKAAASMSVGTKSATSDAITVTTPSGDEIVINAPSNYNSEYAKRSEYGIDWVNAYNRWSKSSSPMSRAGYAMFATGNPIRGSMFGDTLYTYYGEHGVKINDLYDTIEQKWAELVNDENQMYFDPNELERLNEDFGDPHNVALAFNPENIVDSANAFDDEPMVAWLYNEILEPLGIEAVLTDDGAIVFNEELIRKEAITKEDAAYDYQRPNRGEGNYGFRYSVSKDEPDTRKAVDISPDKVAVKEARRTIKKLEAQNEKLRTVNEYQRKQFKRSDKNEPNARAVARYVKGLIKSYSSKTPVDAVAQKLTDLYTYIATGDENGAPVWDIMYEKARDIAGDIIGGSEALLNSDALETFSEIKNYFKGKKFYVPAENKADFGDFKAFKNKNFGRFILTTDPASGAKSVDAYYGELTELFGEDYFPSEITNPTDQLQHISHVMDGMNAIYGNPFSGQAFDEVTAIVASDMLDKFYDIPQADPTFADKAEQRLTQEKVKGRTKLDALRERKDAQIQKTRQDLRESAAKKLADLRQKNDERIAKLKADIRERAARARVNRSKTSLRKRIRRSCQRMVKMLAKPDKNRHIPDELQQNVAELFDMIAKSPDEIIQTGDMAGTPKIDSLKNRIGKVSDLYRRILADNKAPVSLDPDMQAMFDQAAQALETTPFGKLDAEQLDNLYKLTRAIYKSITTANKAFRDAQSRTYDDLAEAVRADNSGRQDRKPIPGKSAKKAVDDLVNFSVIDPRRLFKRLGKTMYGLYLNIERGQDKYIETVTKTVEFMKKTLDGIDTTKWDGDGADRIKVGIVIDEFAGTTKEVEFTPAMLIDLYLANKREQSRKHLYGIGGIALQPPGTDKPMKPLKINEQQINDILNKHMTPEMTRVANAMSEYLTKEMGTLANEVSQEMYGYSKFTETNYWPIDVHRGSVTKSFGEVKGDPTLENSGATKTLVEKANNALVIKSALDVFDKHTTWAAAYNAYVPALADMRHVLNTRDVDGTTIASLLNDKFGERTEKYIDNFMNLVNSGKLSHGLWNDKISKKLLRNFKAASVGMNLSVVIKQPVSYIRAADVINPKYLLQALKFESQKTRRANMAEMLKYNPIARIKDWGFADMGFGKNQRQLYDKSAMALSDKISEVSGFLPSQADKVTWARIWQAVKLEQQAKGIYDVARWAERFREVISSTQVVNTIFTTPPILNEDSALTSMVTAFMAEPLKSFNMLHEAIESKNAAQIRRTAATLITNTFAIAIIDTAFKHLRQKEDEEETTILSLTGEVLLNMLEDTLSMLPYARDMISIFQGYDVERADLTGIDKLWKSLSSTVNDVAAAVSGGEPRGTVILHIKDVVAGLSVVTGIPAGNIWRDIESVLRSFAQNTGNADLEYLFTAALYNPENDSNRRYYYDLLFKYREDDKVYTDIKKRLIDEYGYNDEMITSAMRSRIKQTDEYLDKYEPTATKIMAGIENNQWYLRLPTAEQEEITRQAEAYASAITLERVDDTYELNDTAARIKDAVEDGLTPGEYLFYTAARKRADKAGNDNGSYSIKEKVAALRDLDFLPDAKRQALLVLETQTNDNPEGLANEIEAILGSGLSFDEFLNIYERHAEIGAENDLSASGKALKFANWLDSRYTAEQADIIQEHFGYWAGAKAVPTHYNKFIDAGIDIDTAYELADKISRLELTEGKKAITSLQRYRVVVDAEISDNDKMRALSVLMPETAYKELAKAKLKGLKIESYVKYLEGTAGIVSDVKNGEPISGSRKQKVLTYINRMLIPNAHKDLLYYLAGYSEKTISDAPWRGGQKYSGDINGKKVNGRTLRKLGGA